jgi:hypothetical protein
MRGAGCCLMPAFVLEFFVIYLFNPLGLVGRGDFLPRAVPAVIVAEAFQAFK